MAHFTNTVANTAATVLCVTTSCLCCNSISIAVYSTGFHKEKIATRKALEHSWLFDSVFIFTSVTNATSNILLIIAISCGKEIYIAKKTDFCNVKRVLTLFIIWNGLTAFTNYAASLAEAAVLDIQLHERKDLSTAKEIMTVTGLSEASMDHESRDDESGTNDTVIIVNGTREGTGYGQRTRLLGYLIVFYTITLLIKAGVLYFVYYKFLCLLLEDTLVAAGCSYSDTGSTASQEGQEPPWDVRLIRHSGRAIEAHIREHEADGSDSSRLQAHSAEQNGVELPSRALEEWVDASTSSRASISDQALPMNVVPSRTPPRTAIWVEGGRTAREGQKSSSLEALQQGSFLRRPQWTGARRRSSVEYNHHALDQERMELQRAEGTQHRTEVAATGSRQDQTSKSKSERNSQETAHT